MLKRIATTALVLVFLLSYAPVFAGEEAETATGDFLSGGVVGGLIGFIVKSFSPQEPAPESEAESVEPGFDLGAIRTDTTVFAGIADDTESIVGMDLFTYKF